jgi:hypothetical protein
MYSKMCHFKYEHVTLNMQENEQLTPNIHCFGLYMQGKT